MTTDHGARRRSPRGTGAAVAEELVAAAEALLDERGSVDAVPVGDIVGRVGVTAPVLYAHFADKDALFVAVHARRMRGFQDVLRRSGRGAPSAIDALHRRGKAYIRYATTRPDAYRALFMTAPSSADNPFEEHRGHQLSAFDDLVANVQACMEEGSAAPGDAQLAARVVWVQVHGLASLLISMPDIAGAVGRRRLVDQTLAAIVAGLQVPAPP